MHDYLNVRDRLMNIMDRLINIKDLNIKDRFIFYSLPGTYPLRLGLEPRMIPVRAMDQVGTRYC